MTLLGIPLNDQTVNPNGLVVQARELPAGWETGVVALSDGCVPATVEDRCVKQLIPSKPESHTFQPFWAAADETCGPGSVPQSEVEALARDRVARTTEFALGQLLATGAGSENPSLSDCVPSITGTVCDVVACLAAEGGEAMGGGQTWLHLTPWAAIAAAAGGVIQIDGGQWRSPSFARVIVSAGYPTSGCDPTAPEQVWVTGPVWAGLGPVQTVAPGLDRLNRMEVTAERLILAVFDPCAVACGLIIGAAESP